MPEFDAAPRATATLRKGVACHTLLRGAGVAWVLMLAACALAPTDLAIEKGVIVDVLDAVPAAEVPRIATSAGPGAQAAVRVAAHDTARRDATRWFRVVFELPGGRRMVFPDPSLRPMQAVPWVVGDCYRLRYSVAQRPAYVLTEKIACN